MRVIISAGGTGGHLYPAIATADALASQDSQNDIRFITGSSVLEGELVKKSGYSFIPLDVPGFRRKLSTDLLAAVYKTGRGLTKATALVKDWQPQVVIGFGGAVTYPVLRAAKRLGLPTLIHEQNIIPGAANRYLSRLVDVVTVSWEPAVRMFPRQTRVVVTGNPIRVAHLNVSRRQARKTLKLNEEGQVLTVFGGSQGARHINKAAVESYPKLIMVKDLNIMHLTGERDFDETVKAWSSAGSSDRVKLYPYLDEMGLAYRASDLFVCRAGASTLAELAAYGSPAILIPYPYASNDHQTKNAAVFEAAGAAVVIKDEALDADTLIEATTTLLGNTGLLQAMRAAMSKLGHTDAAARLAGLIVEVANDHGDGVE